MKDWAKSFYQSKAWKTCRSSYAKSVGGLCERCRAKGLIVAGEIVHHKVYLTPINIKDATITLNPDNLELLCRSCHELEHRRKGRRYKIDRCGRVLSDRAG